MSRPVNGHGLEAIAVRRATLTDAGKVRYRVYRSEHDFIAVIAESALMAVKVAGVADPYRIVRDLPTEGIALQAERIAKQEAGAERVAFSITARSSARLQVDVKEQASAMSKFVPIKVGDLQKKSPLNARIVSSDILSAMIEKKMAEALPKPVAAPPKQAAPAPTPSYVPYVPPPAPQAPPPQEMPPIAAAPAAAPAAPTGDSEVLSPEEVEKLLNG